jgi:hypothetical protein
MARIWSSLKVARVWGEIIPRSSAAWTGLPRFVWEAAHTPPCPRMVSGGGCEQCLSVTTGNLTDRNWSAAANHPRFFGAPSCGWAPNGRAIVFSASEPNHAVRTYWMNLDDGKTRAITPEGTEGTRVSPDGKYLLAIDPEGKRWLYPLERADPQPLSAAVNDDEFLIDWEADGKSILVGSRGIPCKGDASLPQFNSQRRRAALFPIGCRRYRKRHCSPSQCRPENLCLLVLPDPLRSLRGRRPAVADASETNEERGKPLGSPRSNHS